jgi:hypothetical protein
MHDARREMELTLTQIVANLWDDFPQLYLFKDTGAIAIRRAWIDGRRLGFDDRQIAFELLSMRGRIGLGGMAMGLIAGHWVGCDAAAKEAGQRGAAGLGEASQV